MGIRHEVIWPEVKAAYESNLAERVNAEHLVTRYAELLRQAERDVANADVVFGTGECRQNARC